MKGGRPNVACSLAVCILLAVAAAGPLTAAAYGTGQPYPNSSWALGVVVPEGAELAGGGSLHWEGVTNVSALVTLPNISSHGRLVYVVMSLMTCDSAVMQVAAGTFPNGTGWLAYSWYVPNAGSIPIAYNWILNASIPRMFPGSTVTFSIFVANGGWNLKVVDCGTGALVERSFPTGASLSLKQGDQEVFALESYSREAAVFQSMGNLTLSALMVDGVRVSGGLYPYGDWNTKTSPLFVVGSPGSSPPGFISINQQAGGPVTWGYSTQWTNEAYDLDAVAMAAGFLSASAAAFALMGVVILLTRKGRTRREAGPGGATYRSALDRLARLLPS